MTYMPQTIINLILAFDKKNEILTFIRNTMMLDDANRN